MDHSHHMHDHISSSDSMSMPQHGGSGTGHRCQMSMLFTWNTKDLCLVFRWWHVTGPASLVLSLLAVVVLGMGYEYVRALSYRYEARISAANAGSGAGTARGGRRGRVGKAVLYGVQVFYSFFMMLLFMTYNGWVMIAVAVGAAWGYMLWGESGAAKSVACH